MFSSSSYREGLLAGAVVLAAVGCGGGGGGGASANPPGYGLVEGAASSAPLVASQSTPAVTTPAPAAFSGSPSGGGTSPSAPSSGGSGGSSVPPIIAPPAPTPSAAGLAGVGPSSASFMTEEQEVAWMNSLGFQATLADLRASYKSFKPVALDQKMSVLWDTESDMLRNYLRLYQRTGYSGFYDQAKIWRDFLVDVYSWDKKGRNNIEQSHVYLMGLVDWYVAFHDQGVLDAINRIIDFIKTMRKDLFETRALARPLQGLVWYVEKIGIRRAEVEPMIQQFLAGFDNAPTNKGFVTMKFAASLGDLNVGGVPGTTDLRALFPASKAVFDGKNTYPIAGKQGCGLYQDCMLLHALRLTARVRNLPQYAERARQIAAAWEPLVGHPAWDNGGTTNLGAPYYLLPEAGDLRAFIAYDASTPLYITQFAPFVTDGTKRAEMERQALLRQYGRLQKIQPSELGKKPSYWPWQTWQAGYFLLQN